MGGALSKSFRWLCLAWALLVAAPASAVYVITLVEYPGAVFTDIRAINNVGQVAGYASLDGTTNFSFTYSGGSFTPLAPSPLNPSALGMNDLGVIVGAMAVSPELGFIYQGGTYTTYSRPGWVDTEFRAINNAGVITGYSTNAFGATEGFQFDPATNIYTPISIPGASFIIAQGINTAGQIVGSAQIPMPAHGFLRETDGSINLFQVGGLPTRARGINDMGLITGWVTVTGSGVEQAFVANSSGFELFAVPGAPQTAAESINNAGQVAGLWVDGSSTLHGFIGTPAATPTGTTSGGAYTFSVDVVPNVPIFIDPPVATGYDYAIGKHDPRVASVQFPIGIGDSMYLLKVGGRKFVVSGGEWFDFRAHGFPRGVTDFRVGCIETSAALDPANSQAFPTGLTFMAAGRFTGTQKPRTHDSHASDGAKCRMDDDDG